MLRSDTLTPRIRVFGDRAAAQPHYPHNRDPLHNSLAEIPQPPPTTFCPWTNNFSPRPRSSWASAPTEPAGIFSMALLEALPAATQRLHCPHRGPRPMPDTRACLPDARCAPSVPVAAPASLPCLPSASVGTREAPPSAPDRLGQRSQCTLPPSDRFDHPEKHPPYPSNRRRKHPEGTPPALNRLRQRLQAPPRGLQPLPSSPAGRPPLPPPPT
jgi:hypothetical protein